jgi:hypothetical protein
MESSARRTDRDFTQRIADWCKSTTPLHQLDHEVARMVDIDVPFNYHRLFGVHSQSGHSRQTVLNNPGSYEIRPTDLA